jgi:hypothetical protein
VTFSFAVLLSDITGALECDGGNSFADWWEEGICNVNNLIQVVCADILRFKNDNTFNGTIFGANPATGAFMTGPPSFFRASPLTAVWEDASINWDEASTAYGLDFSYCDPIFGPISPVRLTLSEEMPCAPTDEGLDLEIIGGGFAGHYAGTYDAVNEWWDFGVLSGVDPFVMWLDGGMWKYASSGAGPFDMIGANCRDTPLGAPPFTTETADFKVLFPGAFFAADYLKVTLA